MKLEDSPSMAALRASLTPEQIAAQTYLEWTDEQLGRAVRQIASGFGDAYGLDAQIFMAAAAILMGRMRAHEGARSTFSLGEDSVVIELNPTPDTEVERLRAELAALRPLAEAAVHYYCNEESDPDAHDGVFEAVREFGADFISRRAAAAAAQMPGL